MARITLTAANKHYYRVRFYSIKNIFTDYSRSNYLTQQTTSELAYKNMTSIKDGR